MLFVSALVTACQNDKYITRNTSHFKLVDPAIKEMTDEEEQEDDDDESTDGEQDTSVKSRVLTRDLRRSKCGRSHLNILVKPLMNNGFI